MQNSDMERRREVEREDRKNRVWDNRKERLKEITHTHKIDQRERERE